ncbi:hypothetical protein Aduo_010657 [Ancylostoma duodenale]
MLQWDSLTVLSFRSLFGGDDDRPDPICKRTNKTKPPKKQGQSDSSLKKSENAKLEKMVAVNCAFPQLAKNQRQIKQLFDATFKKFSQARDLFVKQKSAEIGAIMAKLEKEIETLQRQLVEAEEAAGIKQVPVSKTVKSVEKSASPQVASAPPTKQAKVEKPSKNKESGGEKKAVAGGGGGKKTENVSADDGIDVGRLDLRVGRIIKCEKHPDADALYVEQIDVGEPTPRTVVSGLVRHVPLDQMQNRLVVVLCNLKPAKMRGVESRAMVMCASSPEKVEIMEVDQSSQPGTPVLCPPYIHRPDAQLNPKKKIWETVAEDLKVSADGYAVWKDCPLLVGGNTKMTAPTLRGVFIK